MAAVNVVLPWSTCPMVPMLLLARLCVMTHLKWGLLRANLPPASAAYCLTNERAGSATLARGRERVAKVRTAETAGRAARGSAARRLEHSMARMAVPAVLILRCIFGFWISSCEIKALVNGKNGWDRLKCWPRG